MNALLTRCRLILTLTLFGAGALLAQTQSQSINFPSIPNKFLGTSPFLVTAIAISNATPNLLPVTLASQTTAVCTNSGSLVQLLTAGTCTIKATQPGNGTYLPATAVSVNFAVNNAVATGTFTAPVGSPFTTGASPLFPAVGDFNEDGKPDVVTANSGAGTVSLLLGGSAGAFTAGTTVNVGGSPVCIAVGDFNADGHLDFAVVLPSSLAPSTVAIYMGTGSGTFNLAGSSTLGTTPSSVIVGDFNGDGISDLAVSNFGSNNVTVLLGNGTGGFSAASGSPVTVGGGPRGVVVGDFNNDGKQDIATINSTTGDVTVLLGLGTGGFSEVSGSPFSVGGTLTPDSLAVGDFNGDGKQDIATANQGNNTVTILLGNGSGAFTIAAGGPFSTGSLPKSLIVADFNGDGIPDIATGDGGNDVNILISNGSGGVTAAQFSLGGTSDTVYIAAADFNGDGRMDIVATGELANHVSVLLGALEPTTSVLSSTSPLVIGNGSTVPLTLTVSGTQFNAITGSASFFDNASPLGTAAQSTSPYTFTTSPLSVGTHAFTATYGGGTGSASSNSNTVTIAVEQSQTITFGPLSDMTFTNAPIPAGYSSSSGLTVVLTSNTPSVCLIGFSEAGDRIELQGLGTCSISATQGGNGTFAPATPVTSSFNVTQATQIILFNGIPDQFLGSSPFQVTSEASSSLPVTIVSTTPSVCSVVHGLVITRKSGFCSLDASQAGNANFAATGTITQAFNVVTAGPSGTLTQPSGDQPFSGTQPIAVAVSDFNGDGYPDIASLNFGDGTVSIFLGSADVSTTGNGFSNPGSPVDVGPNPISIAVGDFNGDGLPDLAVVSETGGYVTVLLGDGMGDFFASPFGPFYPGNAPRGIAVGDFNGDGAEDLAVTNSSDGTITILTGDGGGNFLTGSPFTVGANPTAIAVGDFNSDGLQDLAVANQDDNTVTILFGSASTGFSSTTGTFSTGATGLAPQSVVTGDFNGDGKLDLATANNSSSTVTVLLGDGTGVFNAASGSPFATGPNPASLAVGDINGDGIADIVTANTSGNTIAVLVGSGTGSLAAPIPIGTGNSPYAVAIGDFNLDGILDVATANNSDNSISALLGGPAATISLLGTSGSTTVGAGQPVSLTLTVSPLTGGFGTPTGYVNFEDNEGFLGNGPSSTSPFTFTATGLAPGLNGFTAFYSGDSRYGSSSSTELDITVSQTGQTITFGTLSSRSLSVAPFTVSATSDSGLAVTFSSNTPSICTVKGATVTLVSVGTCSIQADQPGDSNYAPATPVIQSFSVTQGSQTITFDTIPWQFSGASPFQIAVQASSRLPVILSSLTGTVCKTQSGMITMLTAGTCTIQGTQSGNGNYSAASPTTTSFNIGPAFADGTLGAASGSPITVGTQPHSIAIGDFNGDGFADFATANLQTSDVTVMLGVGDGTYNPAVGSPFSTGSVGSSPIAIAVGDFNGDGKQDLAVANTGNNQIAILLGTGTGAFTLQAVAPYAGVAPYAIAVGDFTQDGIQDLAVGNASGGTVTVLAGDGTGAFNQVASSPFSVGTSVLAVAVGDFNGDGISDIVAADSNGGTVALLLGNGAGGFTAASGSPFTVGSAPAGLAVGDFNSDGKADLAVTNEGGASVTVLLGNGAGGFTSPTGSPFTVGSGPGGILAGDVNGDGIADLVTANLASQNISILLGNGTGGFTAADGSPFLTDIQPNAVAFADVNGDGLQDVLVANVAGNDVSVLVGKFALTHNILSTTSPLNVSPGATANLTVNVTDPGGAFQTETGSVTFKDGSATLGTAAQTTSPYTFTTAGLPSGTHNLTAVYAGGSGSAGSTSNVVTIQALLTQTITFNPLSDVTLGVSPFTISATSTSNLTVTFNSNTPSVCTVSTTTVTVSATGNCSITAQQAGDGTYAPAAPATQTFNVNGIPQTITFNPPTNVVAGISPIQIIAKAGSSLPVTLASQTTSVCLNAGTLVTFLTTGDCIIKATQAGNASFAPASPVSKTIVVTSASAQGILSPFPSASVGVGPFGSTTGDFNHDGLPDVAVTNYSDGTVSVLLANGAGTFTTAPGSPFTVGGNPRTLIAADFNGDGKLDIAAENSADGTVSVLLGTGNGSFTAASGSPFTVGTAPRDIRAIDFNGDGILDIVTANNGDNTFTILLGNGLGGFTPASGSPFTVSSQPGALAVGDFNHDGIQDIAIVSGLNNAVDIRLGNGSGGFTTPSGSPFATFGGAPDSIAIGDFNEDGFQDLAISNFTGNSAAILIGAGDGTFSPASGSPFSVGTLPFSIVVGDFNGDGNPDFATANFSSSNISLFLGNGLGGFSSAAGSPFATTGSPRTLSVGDFNGDNGEDLVVADYVNGTVQAFLGLQAPTTTTLSTTSPLTITAGATVPLTAAVAPTTTSFNTPTGTVIFLDGGSLAGTAPQNGSPYTLTTGALTAGSHSLTSNYSGGAGNAASSSNTITINVLTGQTISFTQPPDVVFASGNVGVSATATSGLTVTFASTTPSICGVTAGNTATLLGTGTCSMTASQAGDSTHAAAADVVKTFNISVATQTITFNQPPDVPLTAGTASLTATASSGLVVAFSTTASSSICTVASTTVTLVGAGACPITANQGGDGNYSAAVQVTRTFNITVAQPQTIAFDAIPTQLLGVSPFPLAAVTTSGLPITYASTTASVCTTISNIVAIHTSGICSINANQAGNANFSSASAPQNFQVNVAAPAGTLQSLLSPFAVASGPAAIASGDFNGDGKTDLVVGSGVNSLSILTGNGIGGFTKTTIGAGNNPDGVAVGDFNGDGFQDLAVANGADNTLSILMGDGSGGFTSASGSPITVGGQPGSVAIGDFNGDGVQDVAVANVQDGTVTVLKGDGLGGFTPLSGSPFTVGTTPSSLAVGDFNADNIQDLVVANTGSNSISLLLGNGSGGFTAPVNGAPSVETAPTSVVVGDFDGDGRQDIAVVNSGDNDVSVFLQTSPGSFTGATYSVGNTPAGIVTGDFDGDGKQDLAVSNRSDNTFTILLGNGSGGFTPATGPAFQSIGAAPGAIVTGDFNKDGRLDLAVANTAGNTVTVLQGTASPVTVQLTTSAFPILAGDTIPLMVTVFDPGTSFSVPTGTMNILDNTVQVGSASQSSSPYSFTTATLSAGSHLFKGIFSGDARTASSASNILSVQALFSQTITFNQPPDVARTAGTTSLTATASSGLTVAYTSVTNPVCTVANAVVTLVTTGTCTINADQAGDANNAAAPTVTRSFNVVNSQPQTITFNTIPNQIMGISPFPIPAVASSHLALGISSTTTPVCSVATNLVQILKTGTCSITVTQAGNANFTAATPVSRNFQVIASVGAGTLKPVANSPFASGIGAAGIVSGDFNNDGHLDYAVVDATVSSVQIMSGDGFGGFTSGSYSTGSGANAVVAGDFNNDGFLDLATADTNANTITVLLNDGSGKFPVQTHVGVGSEPTGLVTGDFNGDGVLDIAVANFNANTVTVLTGDGTGAFTALAGGPITVGVSPYSISAGDFNADGKQDLVTANVSSNNVSILLGDGSGGFTAMSGPPLTGAGPRYIAVGDFDGDGRQDLAVANGTDGTVTIALQTSPGSFAAANGSPFAVQQLPAAIAVADFNGDGFQDLAVANRSTNTVTMLIGDGHGAFSTGVGNFSLGAGPQGLATGDFNADGIEDLAVVNNGDNNVFVFAGAPDQTFSSLSTTAPSTITAGQTVTLTATIQPTGTRFAAPAARLDIYDGATVIGSTFSPYSFTTAGLTTGTHVLSAIYVGDAGTGTSSTGTITIQAIAAGQTITFNQPNDAALSAVNQNLTATATSGLAVTFTSTTTGVCTVASALVTYVSAGTCTINADQAGSGIYAAAPTVTKSFAITGGPSQTITFNLVPDRMFGSAPFALAAQSSALLPVTFTSTTTSVCRVAQDLVIFLTSGTCSVNADQAGGAIGGIAYPAAPTVTRNFKENAAAGSGTLSAVSGSPFTTGTNPYSVALADFNNDGLQDMVVANNSSSNVSVFLGTGDGHFGAGSLVSVGSSVAPEQVVTGDFNGDGLADIATINFSGTNVTVLLGNGSGGFTGAPGSPYSVSSQPLSLAVGDFNGDGIQDLAIAETGVNDVGILLGDGSGRMGSLASYSAGSQPNFVAVGDFNGDGKLDLVTSNSQGYVVVLLGTGTGTFPTATQVVTDSGSQTLAVGDFDNDGKEDIAVGNTGTPSITILKGDGAGGFAASNVAISTLPFSIEIGDFNGDGKPDLAVATSAGVTILLGDGAGGFTANVGGAFKSSSTTRGLAAWDFDGDGRLDLAVADVGNNNVSVLLGALEQVTSLLTTSSPASIPPGSNIPLSLAVTPQTTAYSNPTGTVTFSDGATSLGAAAQTSSPFTYTLFTASIGTHTFAATYSGDVGTSPLSPGNFVTVTVTSGQTSQTITFNPLSNAVFASGNITLTATASSQLAVVYTSTTTNVCTVSGSVITLANIGTCSINADQSGNGSFSAAPTVTQSFQITQAPQTITFNQGDVPLSAGSINLVATATSGLTVTFSSSTPLVCTVSGSTLTLASAGSCIAVATQVGGGNYQSANSVFRTFNVTNGTPQTITFDAIPNQILGTSPFAIAAQSDHFLPVSFVTQTPSVCRAASNLVIMSSAGTCTIQANQPGTGAISSATASRTFTVSTAVATTGGFGNIMVSSANLFAQAIGIGDFNGDGKTDLAVADAFSSGKVSLFNGDGTGHFPSGGSVTVGGTPYAIAIGDFNGDGKQDFVTPNQSTNNLSIGLGNGNGSFTISTIGFNANVGPEAVAIGDFNGDGIQDLAVGLGSSNTVIIMLGDGLGGFSAGQFGPFAVGTQPRSIVVGDFNGDGIQDLAIANQSTNNVTVLIGAGTGSFSPATNSPFAVGTSPTTLVAGDFNGDGKLDLAVANNTAAGSISVLLGTGTGSFTAATGSPFGSGKFAGVAAGDFNGDGIPDLVATDTSSNWFVVLQGDGTGAFTQATTTFSTGQQPSGVATVDLNGDGILDIIAANSGAGTISVRLGSPPSNLTPQTITFTQPANVTLNASPVTLSATASSGLTVLFGSTTSNVCTVSGNSVTLITTGTCSITAVQAGNPQYAAATNVVKSFTVSSNPVTPPPPTFLSQTISFSSIANVTVGSPAFAISATASSGLSLTFISVGPCSVGGNTVSISGAGTCSITAYQGGNAVYSAANPVTQSFQIVGPITITTSSLPAGTVGKPYGPVGLSATGGSGGLTWSLNAGSLPDGLALSGGSIGGTPSSAGSFSFSVRVVDSVGTFAIQGLSISINPTVKITTTSLSSAVQGVPYSQTLAASGGTGNYTWTVTGGALPSGITLTSGGAVTGTPTVAGSFSFTAQVTDGISTATQGLGLTVGPPVTITSSSSLPSGTTGTSYSTGLAATGGTGGPYTWSLKSGSLPSGLGLSSNGSVSGNPSAAGTFTFTVQASDGVSPPASVGLTMTIFSQVYITTTSLPNGVVGAAYSPVTFVAKGGSGTISWSASGLPNGLTLSAAGVLGGSPTAAGSSTISVTATDSVSGQSVNSSLSISIVAAATTLQVSPANLIVGAATGNPVNGLFTPSGGTGPYTFTASGLPSGIVLSATGVVSGSTATAGTFDVTVTVTDSAASAAKATAQLSVRILGLATSSVPSGAATAFYTASFSAAGGTPPYTYSASGLPDGLTISGSGNLSGTPTSQGSSSFTVQVTDGEGLVSSRGYSLTTAQAPVSVKSTGLSGGAVGTAYSQSVSATGGTAPYTWSVVSGALPAGLTLDPSGSISGIPTAPGTAGFAVQVKDASGGVASGGKSIVLSPAVLALSTGALPSGVLNFSYGPDIFDVTGGVAPYTFAITDGALPPGLTLSGGSISGLPTTAGTFPFTLSVTDSGGSHLGSATAIVIRPPTTDLVLLSGSIAFSIVKGETDVPPAQSVGVQSAVVANPITYTATVSAAPWLSVTGGNTTPGVLSIGLNSAALALPAGSSQGTITLTCTIDACQGKTQTINVSVSVTSPPAQLSVLSGLLSFTSATTPPQSQSQPLEIQNIGGGSLTINSVTCEASWCSAGSFPATLANGPGTAVNITANPAGLASGFYRTNVDVTSSAGSGSVPVTFFITQTSSMNLSPAGGQFAMPAGGAPGNSKGSFQVNVLGNTASWTASLLSGPSWLTLNTSSGTSSSAQSGTVSYSINGNAAVLAPQAYYATIEVTSSGAANSPQDYQVILNVGPATLPAQLDPEPAGLVFVTTAGTTPASQGLSIYADSVTPIGYQAATATASGAKWLSVSPTVGSTSTAAPGNATVSVDVTGLTQGVYSGGVSYATATSGIRTVNVTLIVQPTGGGAVSSVISGLSPNALTPKDACSPTKLVPTQTGLVNSFSAPASWPTPLSILLSDDCGNPVNGGQVVATFSNGDAPLAFTVANAAKGLYSATWTPRNSASQVTINARSTKTGLATATSQLAGSVVPNAIPTIDPNGVVHAFDPTIGGALAPGTIVAIYGKNLGSIVSQPNTLPLPTKLNGTTVLIGGIPSPLFYVSPGQVNVQIPFELNPAEQYQVIVNANGALTTPQPIQLTAADPGLDTFPDDTLVAVHAADGSLISASSPAQPGEYVVLFLLGMGATDNSVSSGNSSSGTVLSNASDPPTLTLNGNPVPVAFAGLAPGFVGLYQINLQIPAGTPGGNVAVSVSQDGVSGNSGILPIAY